MHLALRSIFLPLCLCVLPAHTTQAPAAVAQLIIRDARVLDVRSGRVHPGRTIVIDGGTIRRVLGAGAATALIARDTLDARGRLLTPGLVDAHLHLGMVLGDSVTAGGGHITHLHADSADAYRRRVAAAYLPYGVTLVRDVGSSIADTHIEREWMRRAPDAPDFLPSGPQLVSPEPARVPPPFQQAVADSADAARAVRERHALGLRHVKLYWRLREPAFIGALAEARRLGMTTTGHIDNGVMTMQRAQALGLRHFEHVHPVAVSVLTDRELGDAARRAATLMGGSPATALRRPGAFVQLITEQWHTLGPSDARAMALVDVLARDGATLTPTLHVFAQRLGLSWFSSRVAGPFEDTRAFTPAQRARAVAGYRVMAAYVRRMDERGVRLAIGSDSEDPGRAVLSEMLLLHDAGIPMWRVLRIATLYSADAVGRGAEYGAVEPGRRANLVLFDGDPLTVPRALLGRRTVVKDGVVLAPEPGARSRPILRASRRRAA